MRIDNWSLDGKPVTIPQVWGEEVDLRWEGPAVYRATVRADAAGWLVFHGVSARAIVRVNGRIVCDHMGIWDAFSIRVGAGELVIEVEVTKNGGKSIPVDSIASGFLPFVFGTFGGIFKPVEWVAGEDDPLAPLPAALPRSKFNGSKLLVDDRPTYLRGPLHWGWYPKLRHAAPDRELCCKEIQEVKAMGFNCIKFCLWVPPHHYLEELHAAGMLAWMELPIWNPGSNLLQFKAELERIVLQYRHHEGIVLWTVGCELGHQMSREGRKELFDLVKDLTGGALVKDSSGGAEMYGGDPVEYGDFEDFHPYCDLANYPAVLEALASGPRKNKAILLGECNDFDTHRDLPRIAKEAPYWASDDAFLNDQGVRWQFDLPGVLAASRFTKAKHDKISRLSFEMKLFVHRTFQEWIRSRKFAGSVITGIADTPISTSGFFDDWGDAKFDADEVKRFMGADTFFLIPQRKLPWVDGGNQVGVWDPWHVFEGANRIRIGMHSESGYQGSVHWTIGKASGEVETNVAALEPQEILDIVWTAEPNVSYVLTVKCETNEQSWPIESAEKLQPDEVKLFAPFVGSVRAPAFREAAYEFHHPELEKLFSGKPHTLFAVLTGSFLPEDEFEAFGCPLMTRIDTRTYAELPVVGIGEGLVHSLRTGSDPAAVLVQRALGRIAAE